MTYEHNIKKNGSEWHFQNIFTHIRLKTHAFYKMKLVCNFKVANYKESTKYFEIKKMTVLSIHNHLIFWGTFK